RITADTAWSRKRRERRRRDPGLKCRVKGIDIIPLTRHYGPPRSAGPSLLIDCVEGALNISLDIVDMFDTKRNSELGRFYAGSLLFGIAELLVCRRRRLNDERLRVTNIGQVTDQLQVVDKLFRLRLVALYVKGEHAAKAILQ